MQMEHKDQNMSTLLKHSITNNMIIKMEPECDGSETEYIPSTNLMYTQNKKVKPIPTKSAIQKVITKFEAKGTVINNCKCTAQNHERAEENDNSYVSNHDAPPGMYVRLKDSSSWDAIQLETPVKTENSEYEKCSEVSYDVWEIKDEEVNLKRKDLLENRIRLKDSSFWDSIQLETPVKTENSEYKKCFEVSYDVWEIKNEEVNLKEEDSLENRISVSPGHCRQEKYDDHKGLEGDFLQHKNPEEVDLLKCDKCDYQTYYKDNLKIHTLLHLKMEDIFKRDKFEYQTLSNTGLHSHHLEHKNPINKQLERCKNPEKFKLFRCDSCEYQTSFKVCLSFHLWSHKKFEKIGAFRCDKCQYQTDRKASFKKHELQHKNFEEGIFFKCDKCEYRTDVKYHLKKHFLKHKSPEEINLFKCDTCKYQTRYENAIKRHLLRH